MKRLKKDRIFFCLIVFVFFASNSYAQNSSAIRVQPGGKGFYIVLNNHLFSKKNPDNGIVAYKIERKADKQNGYETIAIVSSPMNLSDFSNNLRNAFQQCPYPELDERKYNAEKIWNAIQPGSVNQDSLQKWSTIFPVSLAMRLQYYDGTAIKGNLYQYKVSALDTKGNYTQLMESRLVSYPEKLITAKLKLQNVVFSENKLRLNWYLKENEKQQIYLLQIYQYS